MSNTYDLMYSKQYYPAMDIVTRRKHQDLMLRIKRWCNQDTSGQGMPVDPSLCLLLNRISLYSTDGLELNDPAEVERVQARYCALLWRYLETHYDRLPNSRSKLAARFGEGLTLSSVAKEILAITTRERKKVGMFQ